jgi:pimeloyl-ACP methyl ester carboxylesterase
VRHVEGHNKSRSAWDVGGDVHLIPSAAALRRQYKELGMPVTIIACTDDKLIDPVSQSQRLHAAIAHSDLTIIPDHGHMVHQTATGNVMRALNNQAVAA